MKINLSNQPRRGIALIIVMLVITVLTILATGFAYSMKVEMHLAHRDSLETDFEWMDRSGVELGKMFLARQFEERSKENYDSLKQRWAGGPGNALTNSFSNTGNETENDPLADLSLLGNELGLGTYDVTVIDNERKFNINTARPDLLKQAILLIGLDASQSPEVVDSIIDWIDRDDREGASGAETRYYERLNPPYQAKNGWVDDMSELLLVRGVTPAIFWGTSSTNHPVSPYQERKGRVGRGTYEEVYYPVGLYDLFTCLSGPRLNINTADVNTLTVAFAGDKNLANAVIQHRAGPDGQDGTGDDVPYRQIDELADAGAPAGMLPYLRTICGVNSGVFEIHVSCNINGFQREYVAAVARNNQRDIRTLYFYWKQPAAKSGAATSLDPSLIPQAGGGRGAMSGGRSTRFR